MPVAYAPTGGSSKSTTVAVERVGDLEQDAGTVAGVGLGTGRAAVVQAAHRREGLVDEAMALATLHVDDEAHPARVVLEAGVVERRKLACDVACGHDSSSCGLGAGSVPGGSWPPRDDIGPPAERAHCIVPAIERRVVPHPRRVPPCRFSLCSWVSSGARPTIRTATFGSRC